MELIVATVGRAHGLRGEVALDVRTDAPGQRFVAGAVLRTDPVSAGPLTIARVRSQGERWYVTFEQTQDRDAAEALRGVSLVIDVDASDEEDAWYPHELVGLRAEGPDGTALGEVVGLDHLPAQDALVVLEPGGQRTWVPFVREIVPVVDIPGRRVVVDAPLGLFAADGVGEVGEVDEELPGKRGAAAQAPGADGG